MIHRSLKPVFHIILRIVNDERIHKNYDQRSLHLCGNSFLNAGHLCNHMETKINVKQLSNPYILGDVYLK